VAKHTFDLTLADAWSTFKLDRRQPSVFSIPFPLSPVNLEAGGLSSCELWGEAYTGNAVIGRFNSKSLCSCWLSKDVFKVYNGLSSFLAMRWYG